MVKFILMHLQILPWYSYVLVSPNLQLPRQSDHTLKTGAYLHVVDCNIQTKAAEAAPRVLLLLPHVEYHLVIRLILS